MVILRCKKSDLCAFIYGIYAYVYYEYDNTNDALFLNLFPLTLATIYDSMMRPIIQTCV